MKLPDAEVESPCTFRREGRPVRHVFSCLVLLAGLMAMALGHAQERVQADVPANASTDAWQFYKERFIMPEGRVVDTGNHDISHSEGQGWSMILALANDDRASFERIWDWTRSNLAREDVRLFSWRYDPHVRPHVSDLNNATDGDLFIAWALHLAGQRWDDNNYLVASRAIRNAIAERLVHTLSGYTVLLPGLQGFVGDGHIDLNLSYWFMPALVDFAAMEPEGRWQALIDDGRRLLEDARFGSEALPVDWIRLYQSGVVEPSPDFPPRFSYDAVRIPLYFSWVGFGSDPALDGVRAFWGLESHAPAWIDVKTGAIAPYAISAGTESVRALLNGRPDLMPAGPTENDDYYSASLVLLAKLAALGQ